MDALPDPRPDGVCAKCGAKPAVTRDGRYCRTCLLAVIRRDTPPPGWNRRTPEHRQASAAEPSPWQENAGPPALEDAP